MEFVIEKMIDNLYEAQVRLDLIRDYLKEKATHGWTLHLDDRGVDGLRQILFDAMGSVSKIGNDACSIGYDDGMKVHNNTETDGRVIQ